MALPAGNRPEPPITPVQRIGQWLAFGGLFGYLVAAGLLQWIGQRWIRRLSVSARR